MGFVVCNININLLRNPVTVMSGRLYLGLKHSWAFFVYGGKEDGTNY